MSCFAIIYLDQYFDDINGVECIATFATEKEANDFVRSKNKESNEAWQKRLEYIDEFVEGVEIPEDLDYQTWKDHLEKNYKSLFGSRYIMPKDFKNSLRSRLRSNTSTKLGGYDPPSVPKRCPYNMYVVEIKGEE